MYTALQKNSPCFSNVAVPTVVGPIDEGSGVSVGFCYKLSYYGTLKLAMLILAQQFLLEASLILVLCLLTLVY